MRVDETRIAGVATEYCASEGADASSADFFLGALPVRAFELLCEVAPHDPLVTQLFGDLYISGYFGGIWLRDAMSTSRETGRSFDAGEADPFVFEILVKSTADRILLARDGNDASVLSSARLSLPFLLFIYGYNYGYIEVALENPPEGSVPPEDLLHCGDLVDCESSAVDSIGLERYRSALEQLANPPDWRWKEMSRLLPRWGESSVDSGREVWERILERSSFSESSYETLLELSVGFLLVSDVTVLAGMTAWADREPETGRHAALLQAGLVVWAGSYFLGLSGSAPPGTFPELTCP
jgi:hypothetical protein